MDGATSNGSDSLETAYRRWQALRENPGGSTKGERRLGSRLAGAAADATARRIASAAKSAEIEQAAFAKSIKRVARAAEGGAPPQTALIFGFGHYRKQGGSATLEVWRRRVARGRA